LLTSCPSLQSDCDGEGIVQLTLLRLTQPPDEIGQQRLGDAHQLIAVDGAVVFQALSNADGTISLNVCEPAYGGCNSIGTVTHEAAVGHVSHVEQVTCRTLDSFLAEKQVRRVDVMKLDVEGAEQLVLLGGKELFTGAGAPVLFCELSDWTARGLGTTAAKTWDLMVSYGYKIYSIQRSEGGYRLAQCPRAERIEYEDVLACKPAHEPLLGRMRWATVSTGAAV